MFHTCKASGVLLFRPGIEQSESGLDPELETDTLISFSSVLCLFSMDSTLLVIPSTLAAISDSLTSRVVFIEEKRRSK